MNVNVVTIEQSIQCILRLVHEKRGGYVCVSNVHMCMETFDNPGFRKVVNSADLVVPDGRPIFWAQKILGATSAAHVRGQDLMTSICEHSRNGNLRVGLYGGRDSGVLNRVVGVLENEYPGIDIAFKYSPPFRELTEEERSGVLSTINSLGVDVLFVGIGCPKQELWMSNHASSLSCVMLGVGAAFDFISGEKRHAPKWMQKIGLEWFYRLISEPKRLWRRYIIQNPRFMFYFFKQILFGNKLY